MSGHPTIYNGDLRRLASRLSQRPYMEEWDFSGCGVYEDGARCGRPEVERLVPIYGDHNGESFAVAVCERHFRQHLGDHLLGGKAAARVV